jgi:TPR repeat protein
MCLYALAWAESSAVEHALADLKDGDYLSAAATLRQAAANGDAEAMFHLGTLAYDGTGVAQSYPDAIDWYCRAALAGNEDAKQRLQSVDLAGWSQRRDAAAWHSACDRRLQPAPPKPEPAPTQEKAEQPNVTVTIRRETALAYETEALPIYWPWYWHQPRPPPPKPPRPRAPFLQGPGPRAPHASLR